MNILFQIMTFSFGVTHLNFQKQRWQKEIERSTTFLLQGYRSKSWKISQQPCQTVLIIFLYISLNIYLRNNIFLDFIITIRQRLPNKLNVRCDQCLWSYFKHWMLSEQKRLSTLSHCLSIYCYILHIVIYFFLIMIFL